MAYRIFRFKNSPYWYVDFGTHHGRRVRSSTGTEDKKKAEEFAKYHQTQLWDEARLGKQPTVLWQYAVAEWLKAHEHKRSIEDDKQRLRVLSAHFRGLAISAISAGTLRRTCEEIPGISASTRNRYLAAASGILNYAQVQEWRYDKISIRRFREPTHRIRYLTPSEAQRLLAELPDYLRAMAEFSLATGLRESNVRLLEWSNVDVARSIAWVHGDEAKAGKDLVVPLNETATAVLQAQYGLHWKWVFPLKGRAISQCNNKSWRAALKRAGIKDFRWHDLRHTWASWHVQAGTSLYDLKNLGGWASMVLVERYAHMTHERVAKVSGNIDGWLRSGKLGTAAKTSTTWNPAPLLAPRPGLEPGTCGLTERQAKPEQEKSHHTIIDLREIVPGRDVPDSAKSDDSMPRKETNVAKKRQSK